MMPATIPTDDEPYMSAANVPTTDAPAVLAMVLRVRIAEMVSSTPSIIVLNNSPRLGNFLRMDSISAEVVLKTMASSTEQNAEILMVSMTAITSDVMGV